MSEGTQAGQEIVNGIGMKFCCCPAGEFVMGSPEAELGRDNDGRQVRVVLTREFWMGKFPVTQGEYEAVTGNNPSDFKGSGNLPVEQVSWDESVEFCRRLTERERAAGMLVEGWEYRLPTEAQWEYACRAGSTTLYCFGDDGARLGEYAWYEENSGGKTHPVGEKKPNAWGLHDMHGNVYEWCADWFGAYPSGPVTDPTGPPSGADRVGRSGSWGSDAENCRSANRNNNQPGNRNNNLGLRPAPAPTESGSRPRRNRPSSCSRDSRDELPRPLGRPRRMPVARKDADASGDSFRRGAGRRPPM